MPVAIRKRSWEEHVTHPSGLQYSYDDLDLVCCHGVDSKGPWMGAGASKQGRRTRCASMPEGCHQLPTEDRAQTLEVTASSGNDDTDIERLKQEENNEKVPLDLQEESVHVLNELVDVDISQRASESVHLRTANMRNSGEFHCDSNSDDMMEDGNVTSLANETASAKSVVTLVVEGERDHGVSENWTADSADKLDTLYDSETLNENTGLEIHSRDFRGGGRDHLDCPGVMEQALGCEISYQTSLEQHNIAMTGMNGPQGEESAQAESSVKTAQVRYEPITSSDICFKGQCCSMTVNSNVSSEQVDTGYSEDLKLSNITLCADQYVETTTSISGPTDIMDVNSVSNELAICEDQTIAQLLENSSKLDTILEVSCIEPDDSPVLDPQKNIYLNITPNPDVQQSHINDKHAATEQHAQNLPSCSAEVNDESSPEGIHGNQASQRYFSESPASEVAYGQTEHNGPGATVSRMEETDEAVRRVTYSDTHISTSVLDGTKEPADLKQDNVVKVRMKKICVWGDLCNVLLFLNHSLQNKVL
ncbi:Hypothetical protein SMAX5B_007281 [Scophthalmus maximus]|uniref:Uncharacterized protein n=1 Tax=Scophthalmus maximus TaxID=52904 RepID=A0A2U9BNZ9_SCOMX|nr:Hypothetical protein SMAX5B_007281 [Scophthalmus maximus]